MTAVQLALAPLIYAIHGRPGATDEIAEAFRLVMGLVLTLWLVIALAAPEITALVATDAYAAGAAVIPLQVPAIILTGALVFAPGLAIVTRTAPITVISILGAIMNTALNILLVPVLGIGGAAVATLVTSALVFGVMMWQSQRHYPIPYPFGRVIVGAGIVIVAIALTGVPVGAPIPQWGRVAIAGVALFGLTFAGVIEPRRWVRLTRSERPAA